MPEPHMDIGHTESSAPRLEKTRCSAEAVLMSGLVEMLFVFDPLSLYLSLSEL